MNATARQICRAMDDAANRSFYKGQSCVSFDRDGVIILIALLMVADVFAISGLLLR